MHLKNSTSFAEDSSILQQIVDLVITFFFSYQQIFQCGTFHMLDAVVVEQMLKEGVLVCVIKRSPLDNCKLPAAIKVCVTAGHSEGDLLLVTSKLKAVTNKVLS